MSMQRQTIRSGNMAIWYSQHICHVSFANGKGTHDNTSELGMKKMSPVKRNFTTRVPDLLTAVLIVLFKFHILESPKLI